MTTDKHELDETEEIFSEFFAMVANAKEYPQRGETNARAVLIEYMKLTESYEKLLKTSVRISKMGDKTQKKLLKYKELVDSLRHLD
ncbi:MAG: hypothetical protein IPJ75_06000 [Ignavibacteriales bacterium]|nr:hypothetical protein [Ignavibacteriales bacterium]